MVCEKNTTWKIRPLVNQVHLGYTQREAEVDHHAVQDNTDLFRRITTSDETTEKQHNKILSTDHRVELRRGKTR